MSLVEGWMPPNRENYNKLMLFWQIGFPILGNAQWIIGWYGMGKTSVVSRLNIPGRLAWLTMECPGFLTLLYVMNTLPAKHGITDLPWQNKVLAGLFVLHYSYRAVLFPFMQPSISPIHVSVWALAISFQVMNATSLGGWLAAYGPTTAEAWASTGPLALARFSLGLIVFYAGLSGNFFHDEELRAIRRRKMKADRERRKEDVTATSSSARTIGNAKDAGGPGKDDESGGGAGKHYSIPEAGFFRFMLYPHYLCEWVEWTGFWIAAGLGCAPARTFVLNEIFTMAPRAVRGKWWYMERFGEERIGKKWAIVPGIY